MLKKVSDNIIRLLRYLNYPSIDSQQFSEFIDNRVPSLICRLVEEEETEHKEIDHQLLDSLEAAIDELNDCLPEDIDLKNLNERLTK